MEHLQGIAWGIAVAVAMLSCLAALFAVSAGLMAGVFLSFLALFVPSLRRTAPYVLLIPLCAAIAGWSLFLGLVNYDGHPMEIDQLIRAGSVGIWVAFTLGAVAGASLGFLLAKHITRTWQRPSIPFTPPVAADAPRGG